MDLNSEVKIINIFNLTPSQLFSDGSSSGINGSFYHVGIPSLQGSYSFVYVGPYFQTTPWLWVSPQIGMYTVGNDQDYALVSLWTLFNLPWQKLTLFAEVDNNFLPGKDLLYTYFSLDRPLSAFYIDAQAEGFDDVFTYGPHLGFNKGPLKVEGQYHLSLSDVNKGDTFQLYSGLTF